MTHPLALVLSHVRSKARPGQYDAILLAEVDRLAAEVVRLSASIRQAFEELRDNDDAGAYLTLKHSGVDHV